MKYVALATCAYLLVYLGVRMFDQATGDAVSILFALMAIGTMLAGHRFGGYACVIAGGLAALFGGIDIAAHPHGPGLAFTVSYVAAGLIAVGAGLVLSRRTPAQDSDPAA